MRRRLVSLLAVFLFLWEPLRVSSELLMSYSSLSMRGPAAVVELIAHGIVAAIAVAAARSLWDGAPHAATLARAAVVLSAATTIQSLYWTRLPRQTTPGDEPIFAAAATLHSAAWLIYLGRRGAQRS